MELVRILLLFSLLAVTYVSSQNLNLLLLHTNDMHGKFEEVTPLATTCNELERNKTCVGGFARLAHEIRRYRKWGESNGRKVLFLNAGDIFVGSDWYSVHKWKICVEFLNILQPDVITLGNHEFDDGLDILRQFTKSIKCPIVSANFNTSFVDPVKKSTVLEINGRKIGVIGYLTPETAFLSDTEQLNIVDELEAVKEESERLDKEGVKIIIGLGHSGFDTDKRLAEHVPLLDLVIGGHSNTFLWNGPKPHEEDVQGPYPTVITQKSGKKVPVVQAYAYTLYLGRLNVTFDENGDLIEFGGQPEYLSSNIPQAEDVLELLEKFRPEVDKTNQEVVGKSSVFLDGMCRTRECNFGNLITDAMVYYSAFHNQMDDIWTNASIALYNSGNLRNSINVTYTEGNITKGELLAAIPFKNELVTVDLKGSVILEALEHTVENYANNFISAQFLQVSGLRVVYDLGKPKGRRVASVKVRCSNCTIPNYENLNVDADYSVLLTDFILKGGDGFSMIKEKSRNVIEHKVPVFDLILWYLSKQSPVYPEVQGRIKFINTPNSSTYLRVTYWIFVMPLSVWLLRLN
ncbi:protein 5NUC-like [Coccinella septempunctata]|uniref:protein 5NUC-like n=1 Tax=Coccinella septempunctata TaxID=41139 RepID=UPI001D07A5C8|nr:protein 5NUC-like [Coccinella septempunctata]